MLFQLTGLNLLTQTVLSQGFLRLLLDALLCVLRCLPLPGFPSTPSTVVPALVCPRKSVRFQLPPFWPLRRNLCRAVHDRRRCPAISLLLLLWGVLWQIDVADRCQRIDVGGLMLVIDVGRLMSAD